MKKLCLVLVLEIDAVMVIVPTAEDTILKVKEKIKKYVIPQLLGG